MNITTRQLKAFLLVARHRNFSRAAEQMFIAQSGLSLMIRELEDQLGFRLFDRTTRQVRLTESGAQFLSVAEQNIQDIETVVSRIGDSARKANLSLSIGAPPMASANLLPEVIATFQARNQNVRIRLIDSDIGSISELVKSGDIDMGFGMFIKPTPGVLRIPLFRFSLVVASADDFARSHSAPWRWADLVGQKLIALPPDNPIQQLIDKNMAHAGHRDAPAFVVNFLDTQIGLVAAGCGIAVLPSTALPACKNRNVRMAPLMNPSAELDFFQVSDRSRKLPPCADDFTDLLKQSVRKSLERFTG